MEDHDEDESGCWQVDGGWLGARVRLSLCPLDPLPQPGSPTSTAGGRHNQEEEEDVRRWTKIRRDVYCKLRGLCSLN